jgi:hypothetical protein
MWYPVLLLSSSLVGYANRYSVERSSECEQETLGGGGGG